MNVDLTSEIRFRCPDCQKLFCTEPDLFQSANSVLFDCTSCNKEFVLKNNKTSFGLYQTEHSSMALNNKSAQSVCPKCQSLKPLKQDECESCGILESKFKLNNQFNNPVLYEINKAWSRVLKDLTQDSQHQIFLDIAQKHQALNQAAQKYQELKDMMGSDLLIEKYLRQIELRLESHVKNQLQKNHAQSSNQSPIHFYDWFKSGRAYFFISLIGTFMLILHRLKPTFPNLDGLVVAVTVLSYALWMTTRPSKN